MEWCGKDEELGHEYHCVAESGECPFVGGFSKIRFIPLDSGLFGQIPYHYKEVQRIKNMRKARRFQKFDENSPTSRRQHKK